MPVYIECREDRVILQPEGIVLTGRDFPDPVGPDNPLASALRAKREYLAQLRGDRWAEEPYPLIIVRPGSARSYSAARAAMKSWETEFGYELIPDSMNVAYPASDPELTRRLQETVNDARKRQAFIRQVASTKARPSTGTLLRTARGRGGFVRDGDTEREDDQSRIGSASRSRGGPFSGSYRSTESGHAGRPARDSQQPTTGHSSWKSPGGSPRTGGETAVSSGPTPSAIAQIRGRNWAIPQTAQGSIGISRPIVVTCDVDRLVLHAARGTSQNNVVVNMTDSTRNAVEPLITALWKRIESWGIAGPGVYWKPELDVSVKSGAEERFRELEALLHNSGIGVVRR